MAFGTHGAAAVRQMRNRKHAPNMRVEFDKEAHKHNFKFKHGEEPKKLTAKEIARLRFYLQQAKRNKLKYQIAALLISIALLAVLVWGILFSVEWLQELPADVYHKK